MSPQDILNLEETADYTRLSTTTIRRAAVRGELHGSKAGGRWTFRRSDIDAWWEAGCPQPRRRHPDPMPAPRLRRGSSFREKVVDLEARRAS